MKYKEKKEKCECWFCDEKWVRGHKGHHKQLLIMDVVEVEEEIVMDEDEMLPELYNMELSECVFLWNYS